MTRRRRGRHCPRPFVRRHFFAPLFLLPDVTTTRRMRHDDEEEARSPLSPPFWATPFFFLPFFSPRRHADKEEAT